MAAELNGIQAPPVPLAIASSNGGSSWVVEIDNMIDFTELPEQRADHSIYRVPEYIKEMTNRNAYRPQLVSLGPFHHGDAALLPMEAHKRRAVAHLVKRSGKPLREFIAAVEEISDQLEGAYENLDKEKWSRERFVELMITDGCFLLEVMRTVRLEGEVEEDYGPDDPIFSQHGWIYLHDNIMSDMILIENQLPLLLLQELMLVAADTDTSGSESEDDGEDITTWVLALLSIAVTRTTVLPVDDNLGLHPLDVLQKSVRGTRRQRRWSHVVDAVPSATELHEAGIHFKVSDANGFSGAVSFEEGVLSLPKIFLYDNAECILLNLMAYERLHPAAGNEVNAFVHLLDDLIDTAKDVALLRSKGIVECGLGSDEAVANLINKTLTKGAAMYPDSILHDVTWELNAHCKRPWNSWRASFKHKYLSNPWVFISLVAAIVLLIATVMQTVYTIVPFYKNKS